MRKNVIIKKRKMEKFKKNKREAIIDLTIYFEKKKPFPCFVLYANE